MALKRSDETNYAAEPVAIPVNGNGAMPPKPSPVAYVDSTEILENGAVGERYKAESLVVNAHEEKFVVDQSFIDYLADFTKVSFENRRANAAAHINASSNTQELIRALETELYFVKLGLLPYFQNK